MQHLQKKTYNFESIIQSSINMNRIFINKLNKEELSDCWHQLGQPSTGSVDDLRTTLRAYMNKVDIPPDHIELLKSFSALYLEISMTIFRSTSPVPRFQTTANSKLKLLPRTPDYTSHASICDTVRNWVVESTSTIIIFYF